MRWVLPCSIAVALLVAGCRKTQSRPASGGATDPFVVAEDAADSTATESRTEGLMTSLVAATASGVSLASTSPDLETSLSPQTLGDGAKAVYLPRNCLNVTEDAASQTVTYAFNRCSGPLGAVLVTGEVRVRYATPDARTLVLDATGTDLKIAGAVLDFSSHSEITVDGASRTMHHTAQLTGTTARGAEISRSVDKTLRWNLGEACLAVEGTSSGSFRGRDAEAELTGYRKCRQSCPDKGGKLTVRFGDASVSIAFDGSSTAHVTTSDGREKQVALGCQ